MKSPLILTGFLAAAAVWKIHAAPAEGQRLEPPIKILSVRRIAS